MRWFFKKKKHNSSADEKKKENDLPEYIKIQHFWREVFDDYVAKSDISKKVEKLTSGMDDISKEYVKKYFEIYDLLKYGEDNILVKSTFAYTDYDIDTLKKAKEASENFEPFPVHISNFTRYNKYGLADVPQYALDRINAKTIIDGGGYTGDTAVLFSQIFPDSQIDVYEPNEINIQSIINLSDRYKNIKPLFKGLGDQKDRLVLNSSHTAVDAGASFVVRKIRPNLKASEVDVVCIDDEYKNKDVGLIKLDVEGFESKVVRGASSVIRQQTPVLLVAMYHNPHDFFDIKEYLESLNVGYKFMIRRSEMVIPLADLVLIAYR